MANHLYDALFGRHEGSGADFLILPDGGRVIHTAFAARASRFAGALVAAGLQPGDRVALQLEKSPDMLAVIAGAIRAGVVFLPLNPAYTAAEVSYFVSDAGVKLLLCDGASEADLAPVAEAARLMSDRGISCVVAMHRREVAGILTEKDLLKRVVALHKDPARTHVADAMSFPIMIVPSTYSVISATRKMDQMHLHRLVVADGNKVCGIVTQTDLMRVIRKELDRLQSQRRRLTALMQRGGQDPSAPQQDD